MIERPASYEVSKFTAKHLNVLHSKFAALIEALKPAFVRAESVTAADPLFKENVLRSSDRDRRYKSPAEVLKWASARVEKLGELTKRVESKESTIISGADLDCLRQVRAFCITFKSIANAQYGDSAKFNCAEPKIATLLYHRTIPQIENAGVFNLLELVLHNEQANSKTDIGDIRKNVEVGRTLFDVAFVMQEISLNPDLVREKPLPAKIELQIAKPEAKAAAAIELDLGDARRKKTEVLKPPKNWKTRQVIKVEQPELWLR